jgi:hypothetical protein
VLLDQLTSVWPGSQHSLHKLLNMQPLRFRWLANRGAEARNCSKRHESSSTKACKRKQDSICRVFCDIDLRKNVGLRCPAALCRAAVFDLSWYLCCTVQGLHARQALLPTDTCFFALLYLGSRGSTGGREGVHRVFADPVRRFRYSRNEAMLISRHLTSFSIFKFPASCLVLPPRQVIIAGIDQKP